MATSPHILATATPAHATTSPVARRPTLVREVGRGTKTGGGATVGPLATAIPANIPAKRGLLPETTLADVGEGPLATDIGTRLPEVVRRSPSRRLPVGRRVAPMAIPYVPTVAEAVATRPFLAAIATLLPTAGAVAGVTCPAAPVDGRPVQTGEVASVDVVGRRVATSPALAVPASPRPAAGPVRVATLERPILAGLAEILDPPDVDAPATGRLALLAGAPTHMELGITSHALAQGTVVRAWTPLVGTIGVAEAPTGLPRPARAVVGVATAPVLAAVGPAVPVGLPTLARLATPRGRGAVEAALPGASGTMERRARGAAHAVVAPTVPEMRTFVATRRRATGAPAGDDVASLRILVAAAILPSGSAVVPTAKGIGRRPPIRDGRAAVGRPVARLGGPARKGILVASPRPSVGPDATVPYAVVPILGAQAKARTLAVAAMEAVAGTRHRATLTRAYRVVRRVLVPTLPGVVAEEVLARPGTTVLVANATGMAALQAIGAMATNIHDGVRRSGPATILGTGKVAGDERPVGRRRPAVPSQAASREAALPSDPRPSNATANVGRPLGLAVQATATPGTVLDAPVTVPAWVGRRAVGAQEGAIRLPRRQRPIPATPGPVPAVALAIRGLEAAASLAETIRTTTSKALTMVALTRRLANVVVPTTASEATRKTRPSTVEAVTPRAKAASPKN